MAISVAGKQVIRICPYENNSYAHILLHLGAWRCWVRLWVHDHTEAHNRLNHGQTPLSPLHASDKCNFCRRSVLWGLPGGVFLTPDCLPFSPLVGGVDMLMTFTIIVVLVVMDTGTARFLRKGNE